MSAEFKLTAELVAKKIEEKRGNMTMVARACGVSRQTVYQFIKTRPSLQEALHQSRESMLDNAESSLYNKVLAGEGWAVCFFLKTQGKPRGYVERQEVTGADGGPQEHVLTIVEKIVDAKSIDNPDAQSAA